MPVDEGDDERWAELPGGFGGSECSTSSSDDDDGGGGERESDQSIDNISSLSRDGEKGTLVFPLPSTTTTTATSTRTLRIAHDSTQGLAARVWPSAAMLVEFIASEIRRQGESGGGSGGGDDKNDDNKNDTKKTKKTFSWKGASVVELGCGPGLTGIAVASLAAGSRVLLTDLEGPALRLARENAEANAAEVERGGGGGGVRVAELRWGSEAPFPCLSSCEFFDNGRVDAVIAADVIYDAALFAPLLRTLEDLAFPGSSGNGSGRGGGNGNDDDEQKEPKGSSPDRRPPPPPRILIAHVRRWKRDARFWAAARKRFDVVDVTPRWKREGGGGEANKEEEEEEGDDADDGGENNNGKRYSSFERGALRVFELVPRETKK